MTRHVMVALLVGLAAPPIARGGPATFRPEPVGAIGDVVTDPEALARVAADILRYLEAHPDDRAATAVAATGVDAATRQRTLERIVALVGGGSGASLQDPAFLQQAFTAVQWSPDLDGAAARGVRLDGDEIRVTKYLVWQHEGRAAPERGFDTALYGVPTEEAGLTTADADARIAAGADLLRARFTRKQVLDGVYLDGGLAAGAAPPLVWLPRASVHEALMQGTVLVVGAGGDGRFFNVHRHNHIAWSPEAARTPERQDRLWYFREVPGILGYGADDKVRIEPGVTVAGDVAGLGLGALVSLEWTDAAGSHARLVVVGDTGGAFEPNLFQLDWLVGVFADRASFDAAAAAVPDRVRARLLVAP
jgi:hypothetical protein